MTSALFRIRLPEQRDIQLLLVHGETLELATEAIRPFARFELRL